MESAVIIYANINWIVKQATIDSFACVLFPPPLLLPDDHNFAQNNICRTRDSLPLIDSLIVINNFVRHSFGVVVVSCVVGGRKLIVV